jgi:anti-sigma factor RsiW
MKSIDCEEVQLLLLDEQRGRLPREQSAALRAHLAGCEECRRTEEAERALSELLHTRLPRPQAPRALSEKLAAELAAVAQARPQAVPRAARRWRLAFVPLAALAALVATFSLWLRPFDRPSALEREAVNDHLRVVYAARPLEIESGGIHQVKPWFTGRVEFAPEIGFSGDDEFPLLGGAIAYIIDRKAATFVFKRRSHTISLFVFRAQGLIDGAQARTDSVDGFHVVTWRTGDLGHALVSDLSMPELLRLKARLASAR